MSVLSDASSYDRACANEAARALGGKLMMCSRCGDVCLRPLTDDQREHQPCVTWSDDGHAIVAKPDEGGTWRPLVDAHDEDRRAAADAFERDGGAPMQCSCCEDVCMRPSADANTTHMICVSWRGGLPSLHPIPGTWRVLPQAPIVIGCYIETTWGEAVVTEVGKNGWVSFRYEAVDRIDGSPATRVLWVGNAEPIKDVIYLRPGDETSARVLTLRGPYGTD